MSRSLRFPPSAITPILLMLAAACGHSRETLDAFEASRKGISAPGGTTTAPTSTAPSSNGAPPAFSGFTCEAANTQQFDAATMQAYWVPPDVKQAVDQTLQAMGPTEKATQMMGIPYKLDWYDIERSPDVTLPSGGTIRGYRYRDAGRGVNLDAGQDNRPRDMKNFSTVFPAPSVRAASWDLDLEKRVGEAIGDETAASKNNMLLAPCMNIIRHPYWGRTQETYGEDTYHIGRMATAFTVGLQQHVVGCAKHFAANNIEKLRATQNATMTEQTLREIYGRHFEMVIQDGAMGCIMASYNLVNGVKATQNKHLLRNVLKAPLSQGGMGFEGLVLTDWWAMPGNMDVPGTDAAQGVTTEAVEAGTDIEVPWQLHYSANTLANVDQTLVEEAARRVLTQKFLFKTARDSDPWGRSSEPLTSTLEGSSIVPSESHEALAEEAELKSAVLLSNGLGGTPVLPLGSGVTKIAVIGPDQAFALISSSPPKSCGFDDTGAPQQGQINDNPRACVFNYATDPALGDRGSSRVNGDPARTISPFKGMTQVAVGKTVIKGKTAADVGDAEVAVVVVGYSPADEGEEYAIKEGGDRSSLNLPPGQNELVSSVLDLNKPTVVIIESGSIVNLPWLDHANKNQATIWAGYPGTRGGTALARLILGVGGANFSGKMPMAWPAQDQLQVFKDTDTVTDMKYFFGYRDYDYRQYVQNTPVNLVFPFGHGLSYSSFEYSNAQMSQSCSSVSKTAIVEFTVDITNTSAVPGDEVAMLFVKPPPRPAAYTGERPWKELKSFARVSVPAGQKVTARLPLRIQDLRRWEGGPTGKWVIDSGDYKISIAKDAAAAETTPNQLTLKVAGD